MRVNSIDNQSFTGNVSLIGKIKQNKVLNKEVLQTIADKNNVNLRISKSPENFKYLPKSYMYCVLATHDAHPYTSKCGVGMGLTDKSASEKTVTETIYGAIYSAIENLKNKI